MPDAHESCRKAPSQPHNCSRFIVYTKPCAKAQGGICFFARKFTGMVLRSSGAIRDFRDDPSFVRKLLLASLIEAAARVHDQPHASRSQNVCTDGRIIVPTTSPDVILASDKKFRHRLCAEIPGHCEVSDLVTTKIRDLAWPISLMPVCRYQDPGMPPNSRK